MPFDAPFKLGPFMVDSEGRLSPGEPAKAPAFLFRWHDRVVRARLDQADGETGPLTLQVTLAACGAPPARPTRRCGRAASRCCTGWAGRMPPAGAWPFWQTIVSGWRRSLPIGLPITAAGADHRDHPVHAGPGARISTCMDEIGTAPVRLRAQRALLAVDEPAAPARRSRRRSRPPAGSAGQRRGPAERRAAAPRVRHQPECQQGRQRGGIERPEPQPRQAAEGNDRKAAESGDVDGDRQRRQPCASPAGRTWPAPPAPAPAPVAPIPPARRQHAALRRASVRPVRGAADRAPCRPGRGRTAARRRQRRGRSASSPATPPDAVARRTGTRRRQARPAPCRSGRDGPGRTA